MSRPSMLPGVVQPGRPLEQLVGLADDRRALLLLLADVEQAHDRVGPAEEVAHVHGAEVGEAGELLGGAVEVGAAVEHEHRLAAGGEERGHGGALDAVVQAEQDRGGGERGAGVAGREEGVGPPLLLQA